MSIRILVADDHGIVREGLRMYLQWDKDLEIVGEAADGQEAVDQVSRLHPDIVLMDILMPKMDGLQATAVIRKQFPETEVLVLTSVLDDAVIRQVIDSGAIGYLLKDTGSDELCRAIHAAAGGQVQLSREVARRLMSRQEDRPLTQPLTEREMDVLRQLALGRSNKEISLALSITEKTVKAHVGNILEKLGVSSRTQAALTAVQSGLVPLEEQPHE